MSLTEWVQQFFKDHFSAPAEKTASPARLPDTWPHGHNWDPLELFTYEEKEQMIQDRLEQFDPQTPHWPNSTTVDSQKPFWVENTEKTYETLDDAVDDTGGQMPSYASFGVVKFDQRSKP